MDTKKTKNGRHNDEVIFVVSTGAHDDETFFVVVSARNPVIGGTHESLLRMHKASLPNGVCLSCSMNVH